MTKLKVINGIKKEKPNYSNMYISAFISTLQSSIDRNGLSESFEEIDFDTRKKSVFYGMKYINGIDLDIFDHGSLPNIFSLISSIKNMISTLTPREFQTIFPIDKEYDGEKYEMKDYFYTRRYIEKIGEDKPIGEDALEFLWEYTNIDVMVFEVQTLSVMSAIRRAEGGKGLMEEYLEEQGVTTHTMTEDDKGNKFLTNNDTGEVQRVKKPKPRYLKVIK